MIKWILFSASSAIRNADKKAGIISGAYGAFLGSYPDVRIAHFRNRMEDLSLLASDPDPRALRVCS